jgi:predicted Zn-dependent protease
MRHPLVRGKEKSQRGPTKRIRRTARLAILVVSAVMACITCRLIAIGQTQSSTLQQADQSAARPTDLDARLALATVLTREHKYKEAQATIALLPAPKDANERVRYFRLVASIDSGLGDSRAAAHAIENALQVTPMDEQLQRIAALAEAEAGEWAACIRNIAPLYKRNPNPQMGLVLLRAELASHVDFSPTLESLRRLDLPENQELELSVHLSELLASANRHVEAIDELQRALKLAGAGDQTLLYNLAVEQYSARQFDQSLATLIALRASNDSAEIEDLLGDVQEQRGDRAAAVHSHESAIALAPQEERFRLSLGAELLKYQQYEAAVPVFQQAAGMFPDSARIYVGLGMAFYFTERYEDSVAAFLRADQLDGGSGRALGYLAATQLDNPAGPAPAALVAICARADSASWCGALLFRKAYLSDNRAAAPEIIRRLRSAAKERPDDAVATCSLGEAIEWTQQLAEARHWLEICVRLRPQSTEAHYRLSRVYLGLGLKQAAAEQAALIDTANPQSDQREIIANTFADEMLVPGETKKETYEGLDGPSR